MAGNDDNRTRLDQALAAYIKSRQEALTMRRIQTSFLAALLKGLDLAPSHTQLTSPDGAVPENVEVRHVPPELKGLRRDFLVKLHANVTARKELEELQKLDGRKGIDETSKALPNLETRLSLLRERRRHERLRVLEHHLDRLSRTEAGQSGFLNYKPAADELLPTQYLSNGVDNLQEANGGVADLINRLEKAVLSAKAQLEREQKRLTDIKVRNETQNPIVAATASKVRALSKTRDELVQWVEEHLATSSVGGDDHLSSRNGRPEQQVDLHQLDARIIEQYRSYVDARARILHAVSIMTSSNADVPTVSVGNGSSHLALLCKPALDDILSFVDYQIVQTSSLQKSALTQHSHLSSLLEKQKAAESRMFDRLSDESHLLPAYPYLAKEARFQKAVAAFERKAGGGEASGRAVPSEALTKVEPWRFASDAARTTTAEIVHDHLISAIKAVDDAQGSLKELLHIVARPHEDEKGKSDNDEDEEDIWAAESRSHDSKVRKSTRERDAQGPWAGITGTVGVIGDG